MSDPHLMTPKDVAGQLGVTPRFVMRSLIKTKTLKASRISARVYVIRPVDFSEYLEKRRVK